MFEDGRSRFNALSGARTGMDGARIMIVAIDTSFIDEAFYPAPIEIHLGVVAIGRTSWTLAQIATQEGRTCAFCRTVLVSVRDRKPAALADAFRAGLGRALLPGELPDIAGPAA